MTEDLQLLFAGVRDFGWDPKKRATNLRTHGIDFEDARGILESYTFIRRSDRNDEVRYQIFGYIDGREVAVACAIRGTVCRLISVRRAREDERQKYYNRFKGLPEERED
ncbi:BrnT family toxin [Bradyrhizobium sp. LLZ17]|uniref:BrnT family toxin n=1 Tax=Bradyrhizobium sp. LLZ17 TaxID=3239388 RepID=A0AB39XGX8_9BRAD